MSTSASAPRLAVHPTLLIVLVAAMVSIASASSSLIIVSLPIMVTELRSDPATVQLTLSLFLCAFAVSQLIWGPIADRFGRRPALVAGMLLYALAGAGCWAAPDVHWLVGLRVVQALGACAAPVCARAIVRDLYERDAMARIMAYVGATLAITPVLAPSVGALLQEAFGWRANFALMMAFGAAILISVFALVPETHPVARRSAIAWDTVVNSYAQLLASPVFMGYSLTSAFAFTSFFVVTSTSPFLFMDVLGLSEKEFAILFGGFATAFGLGSYVSARLTPRLGLDRMIAVSIALCLAAAMLLGAAVWATEPGAAVLSVPVAILSFAIGLMFANSQAGAIAPFPHIAGAASAMVGFMQMALGAVASIVALRFYAGTAGPMTAGMISGTALMTLSYFTLAWPRRLARAEQAG